MDDDLDDLRHACSYHTHVVTKDGLSYVNAGTHLASVRKESIGPFRDKAIAETVAKVIRESMNLPGELEARVQARVDERRRLEAEQERKAIAMQQEGEGVIVKVLAREGIEPEYGWTVLMPLTTDMLGHRTYSQKPAFHAYQFCEDGWIDLDHPARDAMKDALEYASEHVDGPLYLITPKAHELRCKRKGNKADSTQYRTAWRIYKMDYDSAKTYYIDEEGEPWSWSMDPKLRRTIDFDTEEQATAWIEAETKRRIDEYQASDAWAKKQARDKRSGYGHVSMPYEISRPGFSTKAVKVPQKKAAVR